MKKILLFATLFACCLAAGCSEDEESVFGGVYGIVSDAKTGEPVRSASVILSPGNLATVTGNDGHYEFTNLEAGQYKIQVQADGYATNSRQITVTPGSNASGDMTLTPSEPMTGVRLSTTSLDFDRSYSELTLQITNTGNSGKIDWNITGIDAPWLSVSPMSGTTDMGKSSSLKVKADRSRVTAEETSFFTVNAGGGSQSVRVSIRPNDGGGSSGGGDEPGPTGDVTNGLYAYYTFEEHTRNTVDGAANGQAINAPTYADGMQGTRAIKFSISADSYLSVPEGLIDERQFTLSFWAKGIADGHYFHVVNRANGSDKGFSLTMSDGRFKFVATQYENFYQFGKRPSFTHPALDGGWHMVTLVSDFNNIAYATVTTKLYIDGEYCDVVTENCNPFSQDGSTSADYGTGVKFIFGGGFATSVSVSLNGISAAVDNLRVYNTRCLTDAEVKRIYDYEK